MITLVWEVDEQGWHDKLSRAALQAALEGLRPHLGEVPCPLHGESARNLKRDECKGWKA